MRRSTPRGTVPGWYEMTTSSQARQFIDRHGFCRLTDRVHAHVLSATDIKKIRSMEISNNSFLSMAVRLRADCMCDVCLFYGKLFLAVKCSPPAEAVSSLEGRFGFPQLSPMPTPMPVEQLRRLLDLGCDEGDDVACLVVLNQKKQEMANPTIQCEVEVAKHFSASGHDSSDEEPLEHGHEFGRRVRQEASDAAWRAAAGQITKRTFTPLVRYLKKKAGRSAISSTVVNWAVSRADSPLVRGLWSMALGYGIGAFPRFENSVKAQRLGYELRVKGQDVIFSFVADEVGDPIEAVVLEVLADLPDVDRSWKPPVRELWDASASPSATSRASAEAVPVSPRKK